MLFGACYYPEHWKRERWDIDAAMMKEAGFNVVRMGEFAWIKMEPEEGKFEFEWLDEAIGVFRRHDIQVILGTPTAGPPKWLLDKHPDIYQRDFQGHARGFGTRRSYCFNNPTYHEYTRRIVTEMAVRYGNHPSVIGWQIDNELGAIDTARCYCDNCREAFVEWLRNRYGMLDRLNEEWGTIFSGQLYTSWDQLHLPAYSVHQGHNPGMALDFRRFASDSVVRYQDLQIELLRQFCPARPVTTNLMGGFGDIDYYDLSAGLDLVSLDIYPIMKRVPEERPFRTAINHDTMRGLKGMNYWVLEHQSGTPCTYTLSPTPRPGELRRWTYQSIARGADAIVYFRWRTLTYGLEEYWHGILQHHGKPGRKYRETARIGAELTRIADKLKGTTVRSKAAIVKCFHNEWAFEIQPHASGYSYKDHQSEYYRYFHDRNIQIDVISPDHVDFGCYNMLLFPNLMMAKEETVRRIHEYVHQGGIAVMDFRAGAKEWNNRMLPEMLPGPFADMLGIEIDDYGIIGEENPNGLVFASAQGEARIPKGSAATWYDVIESKGAETVAAFTDDYIAGSPAVTRNRYGAGYAYYIGTEPDTGTLSALFDRICEEAGLQPVMSGLPRGLEAVCRESEAGKLIFLVNHNHEEVSFLIEGRFMDQLTARETGGRCTLEANGVMVLEPLT